MDYPKLLVVIVSVVGGLIVFLLIALYLLIDKAHCTLCEIHGMLDEIETVAHSFERSPTPYPSGSAAETDALIDKWKAEQGEKNR